MVSLRTLFVIPVILLLAGCSRNHSIRHEQSYDSVKIVHHAKRFTIESKTGWTEVKIINPWQGATGINQTYYLIKEGQAYPHGVDTSSVIHVPLKKIICMSTTHISMISALGEEATITGFSGTQYIYSSSLLKNAESGLISDVGYEANLNKELILKLSPDLIMIYGIGSESVGYVGKIKELGIKIVINGDYLETDPLGRAEWIKLFGALYCKEKMADSLFRSEEEQYQKLKQFISTNIKSRPKVLLGLPFKDTWFISPGNSFISQLINDAGGDYLWSDTKSSVSMPYGIENVYMRGLSADFWLNTGTIKTKKEISAVDPRLRDLPSFKKGDLYNNTNRTTPAGGNDYWEGGILYPHLLLKDIATILHPELFTDHTLLFYRKIE